MAPKRFILFTLLGMGLSLGFGVALCVFLDPYGVYSRVPKKDIPIYGNEGTSKFLLAQNYIAKNYDGILLGGCSSINLDTSQMMKLGLYNASLRGVNLADSAEIGLAAIRAGMKNILVEVSPAVFAPRLNEKHRITRKTYLSSLGSVAVVLELFLPLFHGEAAFRGDGNLKERHYGEVEKNVKFTMALGTNEPFPFSPEAVSSFKKLLTEAERHEVKILAYTLPVPTEIRVAEMQKKRALTKLIQEAVPPKVKWVDFNEGFLAEHSGEKENFATVDTLSKKGSEWVVFQLDNAL